MKKESDLQIRIMNCADELFREKGYLSTSIQDILDALNISKGGFYHHFNAKIDLLNAITERNARLFYSTGVQTIRESNKSAVEKLNMALKLVSDFDRASPVLVKFLNSQDENGTDTVIRESQRKITMDSLLPLVSDILVEGGEKKDFLVKLPQETARIIILITLDINEDASRMIAHGSNDPECVMNVVDMLTACRDAIEKITNAPYGSIDLFDVTEVVASISEVMK